MSFDMQLELPVAVIRTPYRKARPGTEQVCHHLSFRPMDLTFLDRSTKVLSRFAATAVLFHWIPSTIDWNKPRSSRSVVPNPFRPLLLGNPFVLVTCGTRTELTDF
jgi:hypothetical protein